MNILQSGSILGKEFQTYESHIPYILQFMIDFNLYGMDFISLNKVFYRLPNIDSEVPLRSNVTAASKISYCEQEIDVLASHINVNLSNFDANPGLDFIWKDEMTRRKINRIKYAVEESQLRGNIHLSGDETFKHIVQKNLEETSLNSLSNSSDSTTYPKEITEAENLLEASMVEYDNLNETIEKENIVANESSLELLDILKDLNQESVAEEDSILTQILNEQSDSDDELDMTLSFETIIHSDHSIKEATNYDTELMFEEVIDKKKVCTLYTLTFSMLCN